MAYAHRDHHADAGHPLRGGLALPARAGRPALRRAQAPRRPVGAAAVPGGGARAVPVRVGRGTGWPGSSTSCAGGPAGCRPACNPGDVEVTGRWPSPEDASASTRRRPPSPWRSARPGWTDPPQTGSAWQGVGVVERRLPRWSELREVVRPRRLAGDATARRLARAATIGDLREIARRRVPRAVFDYTDGAAGAEISLRRSREAFERVEFRPARAARRLRGRPVDDAARAPARRCRWSSRRPGSPGSCTPRASRRSAGSPNGSASPYALSTMGTTSVEALADAAPGRPAVVPAVPVAGPGGQRRPRRAGPRRRLRGARPDRGHPGGRAAAARRPQRVHDPAGADPADHGQRRRPPALVGRPAHDAAAGVRVAALLGRHGRRAGGPRLRAGRRPGRRPDAPARPGRARWS